MYLHIYTYRYIYIIQSISFSVCVSREVKFRCSHSLTTICLSSDGTSNFFSIPFPKSAIFVGFLGCKVYHKSTLSQRFFGDSVFFSEYKSLSDVCVCVYEREVMCVCVRVCACACAHMGVGVWGVGSPISTVFVFLCVTFLIHIYVTLLVQNTSRWAAASFPHFQCARLDDGNIGANRCVAVCCSVLQCVAVCCSVLPCV